MSQESTSPQRERRCTPPRQQRRRSPSASPPRAREGNVQGFEELTNMLTQLTRNVQAMSQHVNQHLQPPPPPAAEPDVAFDWAKLLQATPDHFPPATTAQVQRLATGLLAKLPQLSGRDHHDVAFVLTMMTIQTCRTSWLTAFIKGPTSLHRGLPWLANRHRSYNIYCQFSGPGGPATAANKKALPTASSPTNYRPNTTSRSRQTQGQDAYS